MSRWVVKVHDEEWGEESVTMAEAVLVESLVKKGWASIDPTAGPHECMAVVAVLSATRLGITLEESLKMVGGMAASDLFLCVRVVEDGPPKG